MPQINLRISSECQAAIQKRAAANGISKATYGAQLFERWLAQDQPPVSDADAKARENAEILERVKNPETRRSLLKQTSYAAR